MLKLGSMDYTKIKPIKINVKPEKNLIKFPLETEVFKFALTEIPGLGDAG